MWNYLNVKRKCEKNKKTKMWKKQKNLDYQGFLCYNINCKVIFNKRGENLRKDSKLKYGK